MISPKCRAGKNGWRPLWLVAGLGLLLPTAASAQFRTTWQMNTNSNSPVCFSPKLINQRDTNAFLFAPATPVAGDVNWQAAPNTSTIGYSTSPSLLNNITCGGSNGCSSGNSPPFPAGSFNFFQAYVYIPAGFTYSNFSVVFASGLAVL